jgi:deoxyribonuclease-1
MIDEEQVYMLAAVVMALVLGFAVVGMIMTIAPGPPLPFLNETENPLPKPTLPSLTSSTVPDGKPLTITVAAWNLQVFGPKKSGDEPLVDSMVDVIDDYDVIVLQGIRDKSQGAINVLREKLPGFGYFPSSYLKDEEQYLLMYNMTTVATLPYYMDWNDHNWREGAFAHPPMSIGIGTPSRLWQINVTMMHAKPDDAQSEILELEELVRSNVLGPQIVLGDLNADCRYYLTPPPDFQEWVWVIPDSVDTTVSKNTDCAYDRIIISPDLENDLVAWGVRDDIHPGQSDHYLVWAEFQVE